MTKQQVLQSVESKLRNIYGQDYKEAFMETFEELFDKWEAHSFQKAAPVSEENVYLITYGDSIYEEGKQTLSSLHTF